MKKLPYKEGDVFAVPLRNHKYSVGLIARMAPMGKILLGYFFGSIYEEIPKFDDLPKLHPSNAIKVLRFGDLSILNGDWLILGKIPDWNKDAWPMPKFQRVDLLTGKVREIKYKDDDPSVVLEEVVSQNRCLERDALLGSGAVEITLTKETAISI